MAGTGDREYTRPDRNGVFPATARRRRAAPGTLRSPCSSVFALGSIAGARSCRCSWPSSSCGSASVGCCRCCRSTSRSRASIWRTLGLVIAAWPAARLVSEPIFGWLADRTARVPLMVIGLVATGVFGALPLVLDRATGVHRCCAAGAGLGAAIYDPAARGFLTDATPAGSSGRGVRAVRRGADGRPAPGTDDRRVRAPDAVRRHRLRVRVQCDRRDRRRGRGHRAARPRGGTAHKRRKRRRPPDRTTLPPDSPFVEGRRGGRALPADAERAPPDRDLATDQPPTRLLNRGLIAALILNVGRLLRRRHVRGHLEPVPRGARRRPGAHRPDLRDVRVAGAGAVAVRRSPRGPSRVVRVHRDRDRSCRP